MRSGFTSVMHSLGPVVVLAALFAVVPAQAKSPPILSGPEIVLEVPWGSEDRALSRKTGNESSPEGPMAFAVSGLGEIFVLDQIRARVVRFAPDGAFDGALDLPGSTFQDMELVGDRHLVLLDRLVRQSLLVIDLVTGARRETGILGEGIPEGGGVTSALALPDGVWLEYARIHSVKVLDADLQPCQRVVVPGRPSWWGPGALEAALDLAGGADIRTRDGAGVITARIRLEDREPIGRLVWLQDDREGNLWVVYHLMRPDAE